MTNEEHDRPAAPKGGAYAELPEPTPDELRAIVRKARKARDSSGSASDDCGSAAYVLYGWRAAIRAYHGQAPASRITVEQVEDAIGLQSTAWDTIGAEKIVEAVLRLANGQAPAGATNTKTHALLSTMIGLFLRAKEKIGYQPGSAIDKTVAEAVEHLKDWPYPETATAQAAPAAGAWIERWYGSGGKDGYEGWSIVNKEGRGLVSYLGRNVESGAVTEIVMAHNATLAAPTAQAAPATTDFTTLSAAVRAIRQAIELIGEPADDRMRAARRVLRGAVIVAEDSGELAAPAAGAVAGPVETIKFSDGSTADPVEKARRYLNAMADHRINSQYFFDDGWPKKESAIDAMATLAVLEQLAAAPTPAAQANSQPVPAEVADAMADSQYLAGVSAGWNAANADDPNAALQKLHESRAGYLKPLSASRAPADSVTAPAAGAVTGPLDSLALMKVVMQADEALSGRCTRGTTNWTAAIGKAVQRAVVAAAPQPAPPADSQPSSFGSPELQAMILARCAEKDKADSVLEDAARWFSERDNVLHSFWVLLGEAETQADNDNNPLLKHQVEGFYRQWNALNGSALEPRWVTRAARKQGGAQ